jgi:hypothetical protein
VQRRERTRHLIELGGLVQKAGLVELADDDRATIYGALLELVGRRGMTMPATRSRSGSDAASGRSTRKRKAQLKHDRCVCLSHHHGRSRLGKTTLIDALAAEGIRHMPEAGRAIIRDQVAIGGTALPWADRAAFAELMLGWELRSGTRPARGPAR